MTLTAYLITLRGRVREALVPELQELRDRATIAEQNAQGWAEPEPEPVVWMVFTQDGQSVFVTDNPTDIGDDQRALPLYTAPPTRRPLTPVEIAAMWRKFSSKEGFTTAQFVRNFARAIERAHGIGGNDE